jgi:hypothetical protein
MMVVATSSSQQACEPPNGRTRPAPSQRRRRRRRRHRQPACPSLTKPRHTLVRLLLTGPPPNVSAATFLALCAMILVPHPYTSSNTHKQAACSPLKVTVSIPELVKLNDAFWLNCSHTTSRPAASQHAARASSSNNQHEQTNGEQQPAPQAQPENNPTERAYEHIYSIKWYKDEEEFYRFVPKGEPRVSYYETKGVQADVSMRRRSRRRASERRSQFVCRRSHSCTVDDLLTSEK